MATSLYLAPAAGGKTTYLVSLARELARDLAVTPRVIVPTRLQARAWRARLASAGGALGVRVGTFEDIYSEVLRAAGLVITRLADPVQVRLLRTLVEAMPLTYYAPLRTAPGFVQVLRDLIGEFKSGGVFPEHLTDAVEAMGGPPRLMELVRLYTAYQERLQAERWGDYAGIGWLAAEALDDLPAIARWACVLVDGFDDLTTVQLRVLAELARRVARLVVTLTGTVDGAERTLVHKRFIRTRAELERTLGVAAEALPTGVGAPALTAPALRHLERSLYAEDAGRVSADGAVALVAAPDREGEVRAALRWLKRHIVVDGLRPDDVALLARNLGPYRAFIAQTAEEFGVPVQLVDGLPLRSNPVIAALLDLLRLADPAGDAGGLYLAWRQTVDAWRSPYLDWPHARVSAGSEATVGIAPSDAETLDRVARWGSVIGGLDQWEETLALLCARTDAGDDRDEELPPVPDVLPIGTQAEALRETFRRFVGRITPPRGEHTCRAFVAWLEALIGDVDLDPDEGTLGTDLGIARQVRAGPRGLAQRDEAALNALKDVLRGLVWAEEAVGCAPRSFSDFLADLAGAIDATTYRTPLAADEPAVLVADVIQARGVAFRAVAVLGLAEGEFPATVSEDPFLNDADRSVLREQHELAVDLSTDSAEAQAFYEAVTRPSEALLLTRPRIADNGTPWQPSPYWEEVRRRLDVAPEALTGASRPAPDAAASWTELLEALAATSATGAVNAASGGGGRQPQGLWTWARERRPADCLQIERAQRILIQRSRTPEEPSAPAFGADTAFDGALGAWGATFARALSSDSPWSASRLEAYRTCPYFFFVGSVLGLQPRYPPAEGLDARQLGNIYHHIFERLYREVGEAATLPALLDALPAVAGQVLDAAPRAEQFRATAWWQRTRQEIQANVERSLRVLEGDPDQPFAFYQAERTFGIPRRPGRALNVQGEGGDFFRVRGLIDRVDRDDLGHLRIIDYKTAGPSTYTERALREGKRLQLPLYALAAQAALGLGDVVEGFYWHVQHAEPSRLRLATFRGDTGTGPRAAIACAVALAWEAVRGARAGDFVPRVPDGGCPGYCPAAAFCWHYEPAGW